MEESDLHLHLSREASDPAAHQDETRFIHWMAAICAVLRWALHIAMVSTRSVVQHSSSVICMQRGGVKCEARCSA